MTCNTVKSWIKAGFADKHIADRSLKIKRVNAYKPVARRSLASMQARIGRCAYKPGKNISGAKSTWKPECAARMGGCHGEIPWLHHFSDVVRTSRIQAGLFLHNCSSVVRTTPFPASDLGQIWCNHGISPWQTPIAEKAPSCTLWFLCTLGGAYKHGLHWSLMQKAAYVLISPTAFIRDFTVSTLLSRSEHQPSGSVVQSWWSLSLQQ